MGDTAFLFDTNVISDATKPRPAPGLNRFLEQVELLNIFVSVVSLGEIRRGIEVADDPAKRAALMVWLQQDVLNRHAGRILPISGGVMETWALMIAATGRKPGQLPVFDGLIAATALHHRLTVVTRNTADFAAFGVPLFNPFSEELR
ncbi:type II toxin-antitoxin system VapC family toxin [Deinococcus sp. AJ005]|uniref:type II toxin-antitoxin system VapC family toxin n=1 Tax=Deinococcus sp. AJ005 TaxID=2652443 RepID=UPI0018658646|nr:type II toxin-antitoxin system VapC family toxin [Deinococcus sp. AJ005]